MYSYFLLHELPTGLAASTGTLVVTEPHDLPNFAGSVVVAGTLATTDATDVMALNGSVTNIITGTFASTDAKDVVSLNGSVTSGLTGTFATIEAKDVMALNGSVTNAITGTLASVETRDIASFSSSVVSGLAGILVVKESGVSLSNDNFPENSAVNTTVGTLAVTGIDTAAFNGSVTGIAGTLAVTETRDSALFISNSNVSTGTLVANESSILLSNNSFLENSAANTVVGSLTVLGVDAAAFGGFVGVSGTLGFIEVADAAAFAGVVVPFTTAILAVTELPDQAAFGGTVFTPIFATLAATEVKDSAGLNGTLFNPPAGSFAVTETRDVAVFSGSVTGIPGQLTVTEAQDVAAFSGLLEILGQLSTTELSDLVAFDGGITETLTTADLIVIEPQDIALFTGIAAQPDDSDFANWKFGRRFDRSLTRRFPWQDGSGARLS